MVIPSSRAVSRFSRLFCFTELPARSVQETERMVSKTFLRAERYEPCDFGGICRNFLRGGKMLLNGARGLSEPQASCPECRFAFKHFFSPLEVPGFWNGARNIPLHSQNTILQILRSIPDALPKPLSEQNSGPPFW